jgi:hypothetical protein
LLPHKLESISCDLLAEVRDKKKSAELVGGHKPNAISNTL